MSFLLKIFRYLFSTFLLDALKKSYIKLFRGGYFALNDLDKKIEKYFNFDEDFFVELGANDGISQSNSLYFEEKKNWKGVLIEPSPINFLRCRNNRGKNSIVHCNACVGFDYEEKFVEFSYANLMTASKSLDSDLNLSTHLNSSQKHLLPTEYIHDFGSVAKTLNQILIESDAPKKINFISIDVEGSELEVLKGIDFNEFEIEFFLIESRKIERIEKFLHQYNYELIEKLSVHDYLFSKKS
tara:strand:- start:225 stop:947 length:723 start_codon:yes stop_codon:yes gene_type:complete